jgi:mannonate dehydratase
LAFIQGSIAQNKLELEDLHYFLENIIPVAKEAVVKMAAHPNDPLMPFVRNTPPLVF